MVLFLWEISKLPSALRKDKVLKEAASKEGLCRVQERPQRVADVAVSHCYVTVVVFHGKLLLFHLCAWYFVSSLVSLNLDPLIWKLWNISCSFAFRFASKVYAKKMHACTVRSTQWKLKWCLSFKVLLSRDRGLDMAYNMIHNRDRSLLGSESCFSVYIWYLITIGI